METSRVAPLHMTHTNDSINSETSGEREGAQGVADWLTTAESNTAAASVSSSEPRESQAEPTAPALCRYSESRVYTPGTPVYASCPPKLHHIDKEESLICRSLASIDKIKRDNKRKWCGGAHWSNGMDDRYGSVPSCTPQLALRGEPRSRA